MEEDPALKINEIFYSLQGESSRVGWPTVFIRTSGCHLRCNYCDTQYAYYEGQKMTLSQIYDEVSKYQAKYICLTGGEPLLQQAVLPLMRDLCSSGYHVSLETSGDISCEGVDPRVLKVIDVKTPDSGAADRFNPVNLNLNDDNLEYKFVICSEGDFFWAEDFVKRFDLAKKYLVYYSPNHNIISERWLAEKMLQEKSPARLQLQLHKYIWSPELRGV